MTTLADDTRAMTLQGVKGGLQGPRYAIVAYHRDGTEVAPLLPGKRIVVGRVAPADLVVDDNSLSRQHARFCLVEDEVLVEDLGSTNGTWVGGENVPSAALRAGDVSSSAGSRVPSRPSGAVHRSASTATIASRPSSRRS